MSLSKARNQMRATRGKRYGIAGHYLWVYTRHHVPIRIVFGASG